MKFEIYTDESYISGERYRSIAAFSYNADYKDVVHKELKSILDGSGVKEFKWQKLKDAKYKFCAIKLIDFVLKNIANYDIRVDVLIWDTHDKRHDVQGRDDDANFERMFFHLLKTTLKRRPKNSHWNVYPDQKHGIDWNTVRDCIGSVGKHIEYPRTIFGDFFTDPYFHIEVFSEIDSSITPPCHISDLFAGLNVFSVNSYSSYCIWDSNNLAQQQLSLFSTTKHDVKFSNRERARFEVMHHLNKRCKSLKLGVSLKSKKRFHTFDPRNPVNFWHYAPQHEYDKAPTRNG
ncbi:MAG: DUF3800 domain-containing protein [Deltaproteobacteria bacterium]|nr:DUF3800 domain-containing protein [Deltaproteobacteria bacterium]